MATPSKTAARPAAKPAPRPAAKPAPRPAAARPAAQPAPAPKQAPPPQQPKSTAVDRPRPQAVSQNTTNLPDHLRAAAEQGLTRGSENVDMQDMIIPRIELIQGISPQINSGHAKYIEGAQPGMFFNTVTNELYGESLVVCPVFFKKQWLVWKDRDSGGGFGGAYDSIEEANDRIASEQVQTTADGDPLWEAIETAQQLVLVVNQETGETSEAVMSMARTRMKVSRQWNSLIRINGFDRFSRLYEVFSVDEQNAQNKSYKNAALRALDFAPEAVYRRAEALYNAISKGERKVTIDTNYDDEVIDGEAAQAGPAEGQPEY